jgi:ribosomal small subunit protein bTHX
LYEYITKIPMGKGDRKTRRGKIVKGTYGVSRPKKTKGSDDGTPAAKSKAASAEKSPPKQRTRKPAAEAKPKAAAAKTSKSAGRSAKTVDNQKKSEK